LLPLPPPALAQHFKRTKKVRAPLSTPSGYSALPTCGGTGVCRLSSHFCSSQFMDSNATSRHWGVPLEGEVSDDHRIWHRNHPPGSFPGIFF